MLIYNKKNLYHIFLHAITALSYPLYYNIVRAVTLLQETEYIRQHDRHDGEVSTEPGGASHGKNGPTRGREEEN